MGHINEVCAHHNMTITYPATNVARVWIPIAVSMKTVVMMRMVIMWERDSALSAQATPLNPQHTDHAANDGASPWWLLM